jgi:hypothetical protein
VSRIHADIDALVRFHGALTRYRSAQLAIAERVDAEIELARASLEERARRCESLEDQENIRLSQYRFDASASAFRVASGRFRELLDGEVPRAERELLAAIASLTDARQASS